MERPPESQETTRPVMSSTQTSIHCKSGAGATLPHQETQNPAPALEPPDVGKLYGGSVLQESESRPTGALNSQMGKSGGAQNLQRLNHLPKMDGCSVSIHGSIDSMAPNNESVPAELDTLTGGAQIPSIPFSIELRRQMSIPEHYLRILDGEDPRKTIHSIKILLCRLLGIRMECFFPPKHHIAFPRQLAALEFR